MNTFSSHLLDGLLTFKKVKTYYFGPTLAMFCISLFLFYDI